MRSASGPECTGGADLIAVQHTLHARRGALAALRGAFSQGRTFGLIEVGTTDTLERIEPAGWPARILLLVLRADSEELASTLSRRDYVCDPPYDLLVDHAIEVHRRARALAASPFPLGWRTEVLDTISRPAHVQALQALQHQVGLTPIPGWILRGIDGCTQTTVVASSVSQGPTT